MTHPPTPEPRWPLIVNQEQALFGHLAIERRSMPRVPFNVVDCVRMRGRIDRIELERTLQAIVDRHTVLRSIVEPCHSPSAREWQAGIVRFEETGIVDRGLFGQTICERGPVILRVRRAPDRPDARAAFLEEVLVEESAVPFDYGSIPLLRATVVEVQASEAFLVVALPHLIADALSMRVFWTELALLYERALDGAKLDAASDSVPQFYEFAALQNQQLRDDSQAAATEYWTEHWRRFGSAQATWGELLDAHPMQDESPCWAAMAIVTVDPRVALEARRMARSLRVTPFVLFFAALCLLLGRRTRRDEVAPWIVCGNRQRPRTERMIGWLANSHIAGVDLRGLEGPRDLIARCRLTLARALAFEALPVPALWQHLGCVLEDRRRERITFDAHHARPLPCGARFSLELERPGGRRALVSQGLSLNLIDRGDGFDIRTTSPEGRASIALARGIVAELEQGVAVLVRDRGRIEARRSSTSAGNALSGSGRALPAAPADRP